MKAVRFDQYGDIDVLQVVDVPVPAPGPGQLLVKVKAASINPGEAKIRNGSLHAVYPATFPSGEGSDFAGVVNAVGAGVTAFAAGDEVFGWSDTRSTHAEYTLADATNVAKKPPALAWEIAGSLNVVGKTAYGTLRAVAVRSGETVAVSGARGGVGVLVAQLAKRLGANVVGIASERHQAWLEAHGVRALRADDPALDEHLRAAKPDAFIDTVGGGYVKRAAAIGIAPTRIDTIADFAAAGEIGAQTVGAGGANEIGVLVELANLIVAGEIEFPIAATFPLEQVRDAFQLLEHGHPGGKVVLVP